MALIGVVITKDLVRNLNVYMDSAFVALGRSGKFSTNRNGSKMQNLTTAVPGASIGVASRRDTQFRLGCNRTCDVAEGGLQEGEAQKKPAEEAEVVAGIGRTMGGMFRYLTLQKMLEKRGSITPQLAQVLHDGRCRKREQ